jgi:hypothetical protein
MQAPPVPANEQLRLEALEQSGLLVSETSRNFDDLITPAVQLFNVPIAPVSLVTKGRQCFKAKHGIDICHSD